MLFRSEALQKDDAAGAGSQKGERKKLPFKTKSAVSAGDIVVSSNNRQVVFFEKNAEGLLSDEGFLQITHEYDVEQLALKAKIPQLREQIAETERQAANKDKFIAAIRKFMQMNELTTPLLRELIDPVSYTHLRAAKKASSSGVTDHLRLLSVV